MNPRYLLAGALFALTCTLAIQPAMAGEPYAKITSPADGAKLDAKALNKIEYEVDPGPRGDHVHLYVDDKEAAILRKLSGTHTLPETLPPGQHTICIKVVNKGHVPIGVEKCIKVSSE
jgi:hypothetical protein